MALDHISVAHFERPIYGALGVGTSKSKSQRMAFDGGMISQEQKAEESNIKKPPAMQQVVYSRLLTYQRTAAHPRPYDMAWMTGSSAVRLDFV